MDGVLWWLVVLLVGVAVGFPLALVCVLRYAEIFSFLCTPKGFITTPIFLFIALHIFSVVFGFGSVWLSSFAPSTPFIFYLSLLIESVILAFLYDVIRNGVDPSPFDLEDMKGKVVIVTGGNSGIGYEAALKLARLGADVVVASRDPKKAELAVDTINKAVGQKKAHFIQLDLSKLANVEPFVSAFKAKFTRLDVLINNAGFAQGVSAGITEDGFEESFAVMHLAHFHLTQLLLPMIEKTHGTIINVASEGHRLLLNTDVFKEYATPTSFAYPRSKLCNVLFTFELHRRFKDKLVAYTLHPGCVYTNIWHWPTPTVLKPYWDPLFFFISSLLMRTAEKGASDIIHMAASKHCKWVEGEERGGQYFLCCRPANPSKFAKDTKLAAEVWETTERLLAEWKNKQK